MSVVVLVPYPASCAYDASVKLKRDCSARKIFIQHYNYLLHQRLLLQQQQLQLQTQRDQIQQQITQQKTQKSQDFYLTYLNQNFLLTRLIQYMN